MHLQAQHMQMSRPIKRRLQHILTKRAKKTEMDFSPPITCLIFMHVLPASGDLSAKRDGCSDWSPQFKRFAMHISGRASLQACLRASQ